MAVALRRGPSSRMAAASLLACLGLVLAAERGDLLLEDQFGRKDGPSLHRGAPIVLLYATPPALRRMKAWEEALNEKALENFPLLLRGVDARSVRGKKTEEEVAARLRRAVPPEISILIDMNGELQQLYDLPEAEVSVTVTDGAGRVCGVVAGELSPGRLDQALALLSKVEGGGACP